MKKNILFLLLLLIPIVFAVKGNINSFYGESNPFNISINNRIRCWIPPCNTPFYGDEDFYLSTKYLSIPRESYVNNITINLIHTNYTYFCIQDSFNTSNQGGRDGNCYLNYSGIMIAKNYSGLTYPLRNINDLNESTGVRPQLLGNVSNLTIIYYLSPLNTINNIDWYVYKGLYTGATNNLSFSDWMSINVTMCNKNNRINITIRGFQNTTTLPTTSRVNITCYNGTHHNVLLNESVYSHNSFYIAKIHEEYLNLSLNGYFNNYLISLNNSLLFNKTQNENKGVINTTLINSILSNNCVCSELYGSGCTILGDYCKMPIDFSGLTPVNLTINLSLANYSYGIDNCSNSFGILSNATSHNITFLDLSQAIQIVNLTYTITGMINYSNTRYNIQNESICVYPNWLNLNNSLNLFYYQGGVSYNYNTLSEQFDNTTNQLNLYVQSETSTLVLTTKNINTGKTLSGVLISQYTNIGGVQTLLEQKLTGIDGKAQFNYLTNTGYTFIFSATSYELYTWDVNPILSATYDIPLTPINPISYTSPNSRVYQIIKPNQFYAGAQTINITFISSQSEYQSYYASITYPGGNNVLSGTNQSGELFQQSINILNPQYFDRVYVEINYTTELTGTINKQYSYSILSNATNYTMMHAASSDPTYGLGLFERIFIITFICILSILICNLAGQELFGMFFAFFIQSYWVYVQFIPLWAIIPGIVIGTIIMSSRSQ